jgi:hypothetical protein
LGTLVEINIFMEFLKMTLVEGRIDEMERLLAIIQGQEKEHFDRQYKILLNVLSQPETKSTLDELEHFIAQNRHLLGIVE